MNTQHVKTMNGPELAARAARRMMVNVVSHWIELKYTSIVVFNGWWGPTGFQAAVTTGGRPGRSGTGARAQQGSKAEQLDGLRARNERERSLGQVPPWSPSCRNTRRPSNAHMHWLRPNCITLRSALVFQWFPAWRCTLTCRPQLVLIQVKVQQILTRCLIR